MKEKYDPRLSPSPDPIGPDRNRFAVSRSLSDADNGGSQGIDCLYPPGVVHKNLMSVYQLEVIDAGWPSQTVGAVAQDWRCFRSKLIQIEGPYVEHAVRGGG